MYKNYKLICTPVKIKLYTFIYETSIQIYVDKNIFISIYKI